jgi:predicted TIM-barrel fold metal-dependent hydrolase
MAIIDSDAHVLETDQTWSYMGEADQRFRPVRADEASPGGTRSFWIIDGTVHAARRQGGAGGSPEARHGDKVTLPAESALMTDVDARVRHMDELGTDVQVLYPTLFISPYTSRPEIETALTRSYNRWLTDIWQQAKGRLRWAAVLPLLSMDRAIEEARIVKQGGACAIMLRGVEVGNRLLSDPYFFPLYEELSRLDLPVCVHTGNGSPQVMDLYNGESGFSRFKLVGVGAFHNLLYTGTPDRFPGLRWGFIELSSQWLPYAIHDLSRRLERAGRPIKDNLLKDNHVWVACQTDDDLPEVIRYVGEDNLVIGTDYGHADSATEIYALQTMKRRPPVEAAIVNKILDENARALYGL